MRAVRAPSRRDGVRWWVARHRRSLAAAAAAIAVWAGISAVRHPPAAGRAVLVAARDLAPGTVLRPGDVRIVRLPDDATPPSALAPGAAVAGRDLAVSVPAGLPLTAAAFSVGAVLPAGTVATTVRLADPAAAALLHAGDHVDVLAARAPADEISGGPSTGSAGGTGDGGSATVVAADVPVLSVPTPSTATGDQGGLVVVAATSAEAAALARAATDARLSMTVLAD